MSCKTCARGRVLQRERRGGISCTPCEHSPRTSSAPQHKDRSHQVLELQFASSSSLPALPRQNLPAGRPMRLQPLCQWGPLRPLRSPLHLPLHRRLPRGQLQAGRERMQHLTTRLQEWRELHQRGGHVPVLLQAGVHRAELRAPLCALQPVALPERGDMPPDRRHHLRLHVPAR